MDVPMEWAPIISSDHVTLHARARERSRNWYRPAPPRPIPGGVNFVLLNDVDLGAGDSVGPGCRTRL